MRSLTKKQIKMIDKWIKDNEAQIVFPWQSYKRLTIDDMDYDTYEKIDAVNPCEIYHQNLERYLWDYHFGD